MKTAALKSIRPTAATGAIDPSHTQTTLALQTVFRHIEEEMETLAALASALVLHLEPIDPKQIDCAVTDVYAWRVAEVIKQRLESQEFMDFVRSLVPGVDLPDRFI